MIKTVQTTSGHKKRFNGSVNWKKLEQYQAKLLIMKEQMKNNLHWRHVTILGGIF